MSSSIYSTCPETRNEEENDAQWQVKSPRRRYANKFSTGKLKPGQLSNDIHDNEHTEGRGDETVSHGVEYDTSDPSLRGMEDLQTPGCSKLLIPNWPNLVQGQRLRVLKNSSLNESFAQKVQAGSGSKNVFGQGAGRCYFMPKSQLLCEKFSQEEHDHSNCRDCECLEKISEFHEEPCTSNDKNSEMSSTVASLVVQKERSALCGTCEGNVNLNPVFTRSVVAKSKGNNRKLNPLSTKQPPHDTRVCIINSNEKGKCLQMCPIRNASFTQGPTLLETDFPDLSSSLKVLSKCIVNTEQFKDDENPESNTKSRKTKKKQPRRKDPISVNIFEIIKDSSVTDTKQRISNRRMMQIKDYEKERLGGNMLDSSNPIRKRGKHREIPPKKKLSKLKLVINSERCRKKEQRDILFTILEGKKIDFKSPINEETGLPVICDELASLRIGECFPIDKNLPGHHLKEDFSVLGNVDIHESKLGFIRKCEEDISKKVNTIINTETQISEANIKENEFLAKSVIHSRKFRDYCDNMRSHKLDDAVTNFIKEIYRFQDRLYQKDPIKAHAKRRFVLGIREVKKFLTLKKLKAVVIAPDLEPVKAPGGLDETISQIRDEGKIQQIPVIFAVSRRQLGCALRKKVSISIVGIINPEGAEELLHLMIKEWQTASNLYSDKVIELSNTIDRKGCPL